jgi:hypothetical protein
MDKSMNIHGLLEEAKYYGIDKMVEDLELMIQYVLLIFVTIVEKKPRRNRKRRLCWHR